MHADANARAQMQTDVTRRTQSELHSCVGGRNLKTRSHVAQGLSGCTIV